MKSRALSKTPMTRSTISARRRWTTPRTGRHRGWRGAFRREHAELHEHRIRRSRSGKKKMLTSLRLPADERGFEIPCVDSREKRQTLEDARWRATYKTRPPSQKLRPTAAAAAGTAPPAAQQVRVAAAHEVAHVERLAPAAIFRETARSATRRPPCTWRAGASSESFAAGQDVAREVAALRHGEPVGVLAAAAAPRPEEAQAPQVV